MPGLRAGSLLGAFAAGGELFFFGEGWEENQVLSGFQNTDGKAVVVGRSVCAVAVGGRWGVRVSQPLCGAKRPPANRPPVANELLRCEA